ncbi:MAG: histone deacetylase [Actinobacteria bacterium]|nr:histone deacetylase [Actinomycetota bacterium]
MEVVSHPAFPVLHPTGAHPEQQARLAVLQERFACVECEPASVDDVLRVHTRDLVEAVRETVGWLDADTVCTETSFEATLLACGAAIEAVRREGFALARPPGHHSGPARAMGFCLFNPVAVAARWARAELGIGRVAILDWDVHHGNGTQDVFVGDDSVLYVSLHQWPFYPGTGGPDEQWETTVNIPLAAGTGDDGFLAAFERAEDEVARFEPELLLVSAGFDAHVADPLAELDLSTEVFTALARRARALAPRVAAVLEGGYNLATLPDLVGAALAGFAGTQ